MGETVTRAKSEKESEPEWNQHDIFGPSYEEERATKKRTSAETDIDVQGLIARGDTSHNRDGKPESEPLGSEFVHELADAVSEALNAQGLPQLSKAILVEQLSRARAATDVFRALEGYFTPSTRIEIAGHVAKKLGLASLASGLEKLAPAVAITDAGIRFANMSMKYIIGPANEAGRQSAQLNRYAAAWAGRFLDETYEPTTLAPLDKQMELMNTCSRLGVEDAMKTYEALGADANALRNGIIRHYGGIHQARESLTLELLKKAGVL